MTAPSLHRDFVAGHMPSTPPNTPPWSPRRKVAVILVLAAACWALLLTPIFILKGF